MSWQIAGVRYVSIGERSARLRDLTLDFTDGFEPVESIVWLKNGGGKSSMLSLLSAVVLPAARDFTDRAVRNIAESRIPWENWEFETHRLTRPRRAR